MKGLIVLANGFEDTEALTTIDILNRAGLYIDRVNMENNEIIQTQYNNQIVFPLMYKNIDINDYDYLIIPGGKAVKDKLLNDKRLENLVIKMSQENKLICAICAGPMVIGKLGLFENEKFTCFRGCEKGIKGVFTDEGVTVSGNYITSKSMAYTVEFALEIVNKLLGSSVKTKIENSIYSK